jgi:hypothetical protein
MPVQSKQERSDGLFIKKELKNGGARIKSVTAGMLRDGTITSQLRRSDAIKDGSLSFHEQAKYVKSCGGTFYKKTLAAALNIPLLAIENLKIAQDQLGKVFCFVFPVRLSSYICHATITVASTKYMQRYRECGNPIALADFSTDWQMTGHFRIEEVSIIIGNAWVCVCMRRGQGWICTTHAPSAYIHEPTRTPPHALFASRRELMVAATAWCVFLWLETTRGVS